MYFRMVLVFNLLILKENLCFHSKNPPFYKCLFLSFIADYKTRKILFIFCPILFGLLLSLQGMEELVVEEEHAAADGVRRVGVWGCYSGAVYGAKYKWGRLRLSRLRFLKP